MLYSIIHYSNENKSTALKQRETWVNSTISIRKRQAANKRETSHTHTRILILSFSVYQFGAVIFPTDILFHFLVLNYLYYQSYWFQVEAQVINTIYPKINWITRKTEVITEYNLNLHLNSTWPWSFLMTNQCAVTKMKETLFSVSFRFKEHLLLQFA